MQTIIRYGKQFIQYVRNNQAVSALEYAILVGVIVIAVATAMGALGDSVKEALKKAETAVDNVKDNAMEDGPAAPSN
ncbi:Flp family type IVb pilin [Candidatus Poriferisocius sp.]|uniref:Flp family type IVb pilin n=1 Tax=Candidatus Poriferisocius sp. TaxID=3101276 RepID=UPI003B518C0C